MRNFRIYLITIYQHLVEDNNKSNHIDRSKCYINALLLVCFAICSASTVVDYPSHNVPAMLDQVDRVQAKPKQANYLASHDTVIVWDCYLKGRAARILSGTNAI